MKKRSVIAIDLGGTKIHAALVSPSGRIQNEIYEKTSLNLGWSGLKKQLIRICKELRTEAPEVRSVKIGSAGPLHAKRGELLDPTNFGWPAGKIKIVAELKKALNIEVALENDAVTAVLGEKKFGAATDNTICLTLGTGLGIGVLVDGQVVRGANGLHPEGGHLILDPTSQHAHCECGVPGCAEGFLSGTNFANWFTATLESETRLKKTYSAEDILQLAKNKNPAALSFFSHYSELMSQYISSLIVLYYPERIIFNGSFAEAHPFFLKAVEQKLKQSFKRQLKTHNIVPKLLISKLGAKASLLGASQI